MFQISLGVNIYAIDLLSFFNSIRACSIYGTMATYKVIPPNLDECKSFDVYLTKLDVWEATTPADKAKLGALIAASLPNDSTRYKKDLQDKFFEQVDGKKLVTEGGLQLVKDFLKKELGEEDLYKNVRYWNELEDCKQRDDEEIESFIDRFERCYTMVTSCSSTASIPAEIRAFMVLKRAKVSDTQRMLVLSKANLDKKEEMFDSMCKELKLILSGGPGKITSKSSDDAIVVEPLKEENEVFITFNGNRYVKTNYRGKGKGFSARGKPYERSNQPRENRKDEKGEVTRCRFCDSKYHYQKNCPEFNKCSKEGTGSKDDVLVVEEIDFALATQLQGELGLFTREARNCAALDTCCSSSVAGRPWFDLYSKELSLEDQSRIKGPEVSNKMFKFGNNGMLNSLGKYTVPVVIAGKRCMIEFDIIDSDIPLLMSKSAMKKMKMKINLENDTVDIWGTTLELETTNSGHYLLPLLGETEEVNISWVLAVDFETISEKEKYHQMKKLHKQFGHTPKDKFIAFMKDAKAWNKSLEKHLDRVMDTCKGCLILKRNPDKPAVSLPMASSFNEKVAIDLKEVRNGDKKEYILHMVDMWSRLTISALIKRKHPREVIDKFMTKWVGVFGIPKGILNDNGGEFTAEEIREFKSILNIVDLTTGAESPWQNGLCEKNHQVVDTMWMRLKEDYPKVSDEVLLAWANMAKNSMAMVYGYSSNQLVFGCNPNLPNIMNGGLPALEGKTFSETLADHLNVLQASRKAFIETENSERIRKALRKKICTNNAIYENGDIVWYKRKNGWRGPGKVVFQDGKVIFVRHGSVLIRVSPNRIIKKGEEFNHQESEGEAHTESLNAADQTAHKNNSEPFIQIDDDDEDENHHMETNPVTSVYPTGTAQSTSVYSTGTNDCTSVSLNGTSGNITSVYQRSQADNGDEQANQNSMEEPDQDTEIHCETGQYGQHTTADSDTVEANTNNLTQSSQVVCNDGKRKRCETPELVVKRTKFSPSKGDKLKFKRGDFIEFEEQGRVSKATILNREKVTGRFYNYFNVQCEDGSTRNINGEKVNPRRLTFEECNMVLIPVDRHKDEDCMKAKDIELSKLKDFNTYETVRDEGQHRIGTRWVLWYKGDEVRARLTARGFEEQEKVQSDSPTVDKCNVRIALAICAARGWQLETSDVKSAFLQGHELKREVFIKPPKEANVSENMLWKLNVALYGLNDASLQFFIKSKMVLKQLGCIQSSMDPALFFKRNHNGELIGLICVHVDDFIHCGTSEFKESVIEELIKIFKMGKTESGSFKYVGFEIKQKDEGIEIDQSEYAANLEIFDIEPGRAKNSNEPLTEAEKSQLRAAAGKIGWLGRGTRPDLLFSQVELSTKFVNGKVADLVQASKVIRKAKDSECKIWISDIGNVEDWELELSTDASLGNLCEGVGSTGAKVVLLVNRVTGRCAPINWQCQSTVVE